MGKSIYMQLKEKSLPLVASWKEDVTVHDRRFLRENPGTPFLHFSGESGTHMTELRKADDYPKKGERVKYLFGYATREEILEGSMSVVPMMKTRYGRGDLAMYFDGKHLNEISYEKATKIAKDHEKTIKNEWRKQ